jgi:hypothetical protein
MMSTRRGPLARSMEAAVGILLLSGSLVTAQPPAPAGWIMDDLPKAQAEARKTGKPIFMVFR